MLKTGVKVMVKIVFKAVVIVGAGAGLLLIAGIWGENQLIPLGNKELLIAGMIGTLGILVSLTYLLRKRFWKWGNLKRWLRFHEVTAITGSAIILWHTGLRLHNITGWLALLMMLILCISGVVGRYLHMEINKELVRRKKLGDDQESLSQLRWWRDRFKHWRAWHLPLTKAFFLILLIHLVGTAFYGGWKV